MRILCQYPNFFGIQSCKQLFPQFTKFNLHWVLYFKAVLVDGVNIAWNHTATVRARALSTRTAIHASSVTTGRWVDHINTLLVRVGDLQGRNKPPASFLNVAQMLVSAEDGSLLPAAEFAGAHAAPEGPIDLDKVFFGCRVDEYHIERVARGTPAPAAEGEVFLRSGDNFLSVDVFKIGFSSAAEEFLHPSPTSVSDFHRFAGSQSCVHGLVPQTSVHSFASWSRHLDLLVFVVYIVLACISGEGFALNLLRVLYMEDAVGDINRTARFL